MPPAANIPVVQPRTREAIARDDLHRRRPDIATTPTPPPDVGCSATCTIESCGDGVVQGMETCDDGDMDDTDECTSLCAAAACGDGFVQAGVEACDDANDIDTDACLACVDAICDDGVVQDGVEECDDDNTTPNDGCSATRRVVASRGDVEGRSSGRVTAVEYLQVAVMQGLHVAARTAEPGE